MFAMSTQLYFIYDSHCPWSYAATQLVSAISDELPELKIHFLHSGMFDGDNKVDRKTIDTVVELSNLSFADAYIKSLSKTKDSTLAANLMAWSQAKCAQKSLRILQAMQEQHFQHGNPLETAEDVADIIATLKLSAPSKVLQSEKFSKEAEYQLADIEEIQEIIGTQAIPALLLAHEDDLVLLNHNLYLLEPAAIVEAVQQEINA